MDNVEAERSAVRSGQTAATPTGFTTRNAVPGVVEAETIESWFQTSQDWNFSSFAGMEELKASLLRDFDYPQIDELLKIHPRHCYLFYGPQMQSHQFLSMCFAGELQKRGYRLLHLSGYDVSGDDDGTGETTVRAAFREAQDQAPCVLCIYGIELLCPDRDNPRLSDLHGRTSVFLEEYRRLRDGGKRVVLVGDADYPNGLDESALALFRLVSVPFLPAEERAAYLTRKMDGRNVALEEGFSFREIAERTEGFNYRDMDHLEYEILDHLHRKRFERFRADGEDAEDGKVVLTREEFLECLSKTPHSNNTDGLERFKAFEERLQSVQKE